MRANTLLLEPGPYMCNNCLKGKEKNRGKRQSWDSSVSSKSCHRCQCQSKGQETQPVSLANKYVHFSSQQNLAAQLLNFSLLRFFFLLVSHLKKEFKFKGNKPHIYAESFAVLKSEHEENWKWLRIESKTGILTGAQRFWRSFGD